MKIQKINRQSIAISAFTSVLKELPGTPSELYIKGTLPTERRITVAIVGSRKPSAYGVEVTERFASALAKRGVVIISGLAFGVDKIAHQACLDAGGTTIAVMPGGLHSIYPRQHAALAERIVKNGGALVSEYAQGVEPRNYHFLARNRIVSGLADAILVTEATDRSGTFSTVAHAIGQNKEVFAVPGPINSLLSVGPNRIIQEGAQVALTPEDILMSIAPELLKSGAGQQALPLGDTPLEVAIIEGLQKGHHTSDALLEYAHRAMPALESSELSQALTMMELKATIKALGGQRWRLFA